MHSSRMHTVCCSGRWRSVCPAGCLPRGRGCLTRGMGCLPRECVCYTPSLHGACWDTHPYPHVWPAGCLPRGGCVCQGGCLPRGCLPGEVFAREVSAQGCLPMGCLPQGASAQGVSAQGCLPRECVCYTPHSLVHAGIQPPPPWTEFLTHACKKHYLSAITLRTITREFSSALSSVF